MASAHSWHCQGVGDRTAEVVVEAPGRNEGGQVSPDGSYLLYVAHPPGSDDSMDRVMRVPITGGPPEMILEQKDMDFECPTVGGVPCLLAERRQGKLALSELDPMKGKGGELAVLASPFVSWRVSPEGGRIAFTENASNESFIPTSIRVMNLADGVKEHLRADGLVYPGSVAWSADGKGLFVCDMSSAGWRLLLVDFQGRTSVLRKSVSRDWWILRSAASPDGRYLAFEEFTPESNAWMLENF